MYRPHVCCSGWFQISPPEGATCLLLNTHLIRLEKWRPCYRPMEWSPCQPAVPRKGSPEACRLRSTSRNQISLCFWPCVFKPEIENLCSLHKPNCTDLYIFAIKPSRECESFFILMAFSQCWLHNNSETRVLASSSLHQAIKQRKVKQECA